MKDNKEQIKDLRKKMFEKKKELQIEEANRKLEDTLDQAAYDIIRNPVSRRNQYLAIELKYSLTYDENTDTFKVKDVVASKVDRFEDKTVGMAFTLDKTNRQYLFDKNKRRER